MKLRIHNDNIREALSTPYSVPVCLAARDETLACPMLSHGSMLVYYPQSQIYQRYMLPREAIPYAGGFLPEMRDKLLPCVIDLGAPVATWIRRAGEAPGAMHPAACRDRIDYSAPDAGWRSDPFARDHWRTP